MTTRRVVLRWNLRQVMATRACSRPAICCRCWPNETSISAANTCTSW